MIIAIIVGMTTQIICMFVSLVLMIKKIQKGNQVVDIIEKLWIKSIKKNWMKYLEKNLKGIWKTVLDFSMEVRGVRIMYDVYKEPTKEERIENLKEYLKYLQEELQNAKSYWMKLTIKQKIVVTIRELKNVLGEK